MAAVELESRGQALWARLNRPEALNGINDEVVDGIREACERTQSDDGVRSLVLAANGRAFCAGADLKHVKSLGSEDQPAFLRRVGDVLNRLEALPVPTIAAVQGMALAGGLEVVLCCDLVVAAESAGFGDAHANYGLLPGGGGTVRLPRRIGVTRAKHLMFTGVSVSARELEHSGLLNIVVADEELEDTVQELADTLAKRSPIGLARMKQLVDDALESSQQVGLRTELAMSELHGHSHDFQEGLAAFNEKRAPEFTGR